MFVYIMLIVVTLGFATLYDRASKKGKKQFSSCIFFVLFVIMGFRYGVGQDYFYTYVPIYENIYAGIDTGIEWGFELLNKICIFFADSNYQSIFVLTAFIYVGCIIAACQKNDASMVMMMYIFLCGGFYFYSFNVMRQCMTIAIFCYAIYYIERKSVSNKLVDKNFIKYSMLILAASSLHISSLGYLPMYLLADKNYKRRRYVEGLVIFAIAIPTIVRILSFVLVGTRYGNYISGLYKDSSKMFNVSQMLNILCFLIYFFTEPKENDRRFVIYKNIHYAGVLFTCLMGSVPLVFRITTMFYLVQFLSVPYYYKHYVRKQYKMLVLSGILMIYFALIFSTFLTNGNKILPYQFNF